MLVRDRTALSSGRPSMKTAPALFRNPGDGGFLPVSPVARATALEPLFRSSADPGSAVIFLAARAARRANLALGQSEIFPNP
ncbi:hypothetical protein K0M31_014259, partial [Melipona bicolor]